MAEEGHSLIPLPAWARLARQLQTPFRVYQEQLLRLFEPMQRYQHQLQDAYGPMFHYWERFIYMERSFGLEVGHPQRPDTDDEQPWWAAPVVISTRTHRDHDRADRSLVPTSRAAATAADPVSRGSGNGRVANGSAARAEADGSPGRDELRRQLSRIEERLREIGHLEEEVEDLLISLRAELARQSGATGGSARG